MMEIAKYQRQLWHVSYIANNGSEQGMAIGWYDGMVIRIDAATHSLIHLNAESATTGVHILADKEPT
jgi:hypothetical protein